VEKEIRDARRKIRLRRSGEKRNWRRKEGIPGGKIAFHESLMNKIFSPQCPYIGVCVSESLSVGV